MSRSTLLILVWAASASAAVIRVPADAPTIAQGLASSAAGDTVLVAPGVYPQTETLHVRSRASLLGETGDFADVVIDGPPSGATVKLWAGSTVEAVTIASGAVGVVSEEYEDASILHCRITGHAGDGVIQDFEHLTLADCVIEGNEGAGVVVYGFYEMKARDADIVRCVIRNNGGRGVQVIDGSVAITECVVTGNAGPAFTTGYWSDPNSYHGSALQVVDSEVRGNNPGGAYEGWTSLYSIILTCCDIDPERWGGPYSIIIEDEDCGVSGDKAAFGDLKSMFR